MIPADDDKDKDSEGGDDVDELSLDQRAVAVLIFVFFVEGGMMGRTVMVTGTVGLILLSGSLVSFSSTKIPHFLSLFLCVSGCYLLCRSSIWVWGYK